MTEASLDALRDELVQVRAAIAAGDSSRRGREAALVQAIVSRLREAMHAHGN